VEIAFQAVSDRCDNTLTTQCRCNVEYFQAKAANELCSLADISDSKYLDNAVAGFQDIINGMFSSRSYFIHRV
jgi:hypothetical protein